LLHILIGEHRFKRAAMQIQSKHIRGCKSRRRKGADKQLINGAVTLDANGWRGEEVTAWVATTKRTSGPVGVKETAGQS
jgi:hypothetical protein